MSTHGKTWVVLANLLLWQLGSGLAIYAPAGHAGAVSVAAETHDAGRPVEQATPCHGTAVNAVAPPAHAHGAPASVVDAEPSATVPCCATHACQGDCLHSPALTAAVIVLGQILPDHPAALGLREPLVKARVAEFFRPPI